MPPSDLEETVVALLRKDPDLLVPLARLHRALVAQLGPVVGDRPYLAERLRGRPDLFCLVELREPGWLTEGWTPGQRAEYRELLQESGFEGATRVILIADNDVENRLGSGLGSSLRRLEASLVLLWQASANDPEEQAEVLEALDQAQELRKSLGPLLP